MQINAKPTFAAQTTRALDLDTQSRAGQRLESGQGLNPTGAAETQQASSFGLQIDQRIQPGQDTFALGAEFLARPRPLSGSGELARSAQGGAPSAADVLEQTREDTAQRINESLGRLRQQVQASAGQAINAQANVGRETALALLR